MIVVDSSALLAIVDEELAGPACEAVLKVSSPIMISAGTVAEVLIVADSRQLGQLVRETFVTMDFEIVPVTAELAFAAADAYSNWGRGRHPARLNYGDCFSYALAKSLDCPLLFVGNDFSQTDIVSALT